MSKKSKKEVEAIVSAMGVFMAIVSNLVELVKKLGGTMENIYRLATPEGSETMEAIARLIVNGTGAVVKNEFLKLISAGHDLAIAPCDGSRIIAEAKDVFRGWIDPDFIKYGANQKGHATGETKVCVHEMAKDATFAQMFGSLSSDLAKLCLTQDQIIGFVEQHRDWLRSDGYGTFFLFQSNDQFFVARVRVYSVGSLYAAVLRLENSHVWRAGDRHRVVVPQLA